MIKEKTIEKQKMSLKQLGHVVGTCSYAFPPKMQSIWKKVSLWKRADKDSRGSLGLLENYDAFRLLVEGVREYGLLLLDTEGRVQIWNEGAERLQAFSGEEARGVTYSFFFSHEDILSGRPDRLLEQALTQGSVKEEGWQYRKDGSRFWARVMISALRNSRGEFCGFASLTQDISEQKANEEALKAAKELAETANRAKATFLANISHEIRTPLGAILGFAELLTDLELKKEDRAEFIANIQRNGIQLSNLINDLLDLSKIEAQKLMIENIEFNILDVINDVSSVAKAEILAKKKSIEFGIQFANMIPSRIVSDPTRLKQILLNLVGNAVKFTEYGEIRIQVKYNNNRLYFAIKDTGLGMTPQQQQKVFQPFAQADDSMTRKFGGTGLGLVLSRQLSKQMGGDLILVESHKDRGSEFLVTISIGLPAQAYFLSDFESSKTALALPSSHPDFLLKGLKILVVEDSPDNQILIQRFLTLAQAQVTLASNGSEGLATALANEFDIILMDVQMPIMDGLEATRMLRQKQYQKPILAVTAHALKEEGEACLQAGCNDHLAKPISRSALLSKVASLANTVKVKS